VFCCYHRGRSPAKSLWVNIRCVCCSEWPEERRCFIDFASRFSLEICHQEGQKNNEGLELNGTRELLICADGVSILGENISIVKKNTEAALDVRLEGGQEVSTDKTS
jgi:hypothetical protein